MFEKNKQQLVDPFVENHFIESLISFIFGVVFHKVIFDKVIGGDGDFRQIDGLQNVLVFDKVFFGKVSSLF
jgi:hypothetical protein